MAKKLRGMGKIVLLLTPLGKLKSEEDNGYYRT